MKTLKCASKKHVLPHDGCSPMYCCDQLAKVKVKKGDGKRLKQSESLRASGATIKDGNPRKAEKDALREMEMSDLSTVETDPQAGMSEEGEEAKAAAATSLAKRVGKWAARSALMKTPSGLSGAEAEEWADKNLNEALPEAVAELRYQLRYGDDKQRMDAARDVLDATGKRRKDGGVSGGATIIVNVGTLPWEKKREKVTDGEVTRREEAALPATGNGP